MKIFYKLALATAVISTISGCADKNKLDLEGERISVLSHDTSLHITSSEQTKVVLPEQKRTLSWTMAGGNSSHSLGNISLPGDLKEAWQVSIGEGTSIDYMTISEPVVSDGVVYTIDSKGNVTAFDLTDGKDLWTTSLYDIVGERGNGEGLALQQDKLFAVLSSGITVCLSAKDGALIWQKDLSVGLRSSPTVFDDKLYIVSMDNSLFALSTKDGSTIWTYKTTPEDTILLGSSSPSAKNHLVIAAFSSGKLFAFKEQNGIPVWSDSLFAGGRNSFVSGLSAIKARTVIDNDKVFAVSGSGELASLDFITGVRYWQQNISSMNQPWIAGNFIFVLSSSSELVCLEKKDGSIVWITKLPEWEDMESKQDRIVWYGPILAGGRLYLTSSTGILASVDAIHGDIVSSQEISDGFYTSPIVVDNTLLLIDKNGILRAFK